MTTRAENGIVAKFLQSQKMDVIKAHSGIKFSITEL